MENNSPYKIAYTNKSIIKIFDGTTKTLGEVRHVPDLNRNIISLSTPNSKRYRYIDESRVLKVNNDAKIVMKGQKMSYLYVS